MAWSPPACSTERSMATCSQARPSAGSVSHRCASRAGQSMGVQLKGAFLLVARLAQANLRNARLKGGADLSGTNVGLISLCATWAVTDNLSRATMNRAAGDSHPDFHAQTGTISRVHLRLYAGERASAGAGRHTTVLSADAAIGLPDAADTRTRGADLTARGSAAEYRRPGRSRSPARAGASAGSTGQNHYAEVHRLR